MNKTTTSPFIKLDTTSADQQRSKENTMKNKYELKLKSYFHMKTRKAWIYVFAFPPLKPWTERGSEARPHTEEVVGTFRMSRDFCALS